MTDEGWNPATERVRIAQDLSAVEDMMGRLFAEAVNRADDAEMPGGHAMVLLAGAADEEAWGYVQLSAMAGRTDVGDDEELAAVLSVDLEPPLSFLASWADVVNEARTGHPRTQRATLRSEIDFLRSALDWMLATNSETGEPWFIEVEDFATKLDQQRKALEVLLRDHAQVDKGAPCLSCTEVDEATGEVTKRGPLLVKEWAESLDDDRWKCRTCRRRYDEDEYRLACKQASLTSRESLTATAMLSVYRVKPGTLRKWVHEGRVERRGKDGSGRLLYDVKQTLNARNSESA